MSVPKDLANRYGSPLQSFNGGSLEDFKNNFRGGYHQPPKKNHPNKKMGKGGGVEMSTSPKVILGAKPRVNKKVSVNNFLDKKFKN